MKVKRVQTPEGPRWHWWCPGCECVHAWGPTWSFDGNMDAPTVSPSILTTLTAPEGEVAERCHVFLRGGIIEYLGDCTHSLAGRKIPLPDWPYS